ncbi:MarR family transcriptional regulator [Mameliella alba]|uniref:Uncharacterized protein n=1 Tax=Mameliella alba TaxID=561184 RepID=A0A0B3RWJ3_9RHOB|nr:MarR family transcriptional regulator [Mameliella alba]KHQ51118.1 hypothetical protein OA50_04489 [Mameliella alba]
MTVSALKLTDASRLGALALLWLDENADEGGVIQVGPKRLSEEMNVGVTSAKKTLGALIDLGDIEVVEKGAGRRPATYKVINRIARKMQEPKGPPQAAPEKIASTPRPEMGETIIKVASRDSIRDTMRSGVATLADFCAWARSAPAKSVCIYHIGQVNLDRLSSQELDSIASAVAIMAQGGFIYPAQHPVKIAFGDKNTYTAMRTGAGHVPRSILHNRIAPRDWLALRAISDRAAAQSAARALRDGLGLSEQAATGLLTALSRRGLIERGRNLAWVMSEQGRELLL